MSMIKVIVIHLMKYKCKGRLYSLVLLLILFQFTNSCNNSSSFSNQPIFKKITSDKTGLKFVNTITENDSVNLIVNEYAYMGGGVGIGDFNNDGLQDIFFSGNQVSSRLYLNQGNNSFKDITETAGIKMSEWCTGVSVVDINADGWQDIKQRATGITKQKMWKRRSISVQQNSMHYL